VHERALITDLMRKIDEIAREDGAERVTRVSVRLGALSHFTPEHFCEHFADAARGTLAEGAEVEALLDTDIDSPGADGVVLECIEIEVPDRVEAL
jgi:hydrogenase nickel incorporation protein HypA/HybF